MSETTEIKETEVETTTDEKAPETTPKKKPLLSPQKIEILVAIFLGITALLTAWATWIGSLHGGNQATNYTKSNNLASEGNSEYNADYCYHKDNCTVRQALEYSNDTKHKQHH